MSVLRVTGGLTSLGGDLLSIKFRIALSFFILNLSLSTPVLAQSDSSTKSTDAKALAVALAQTKSEPEQDALLAQGTDVIGTELLAGLKAVVDPIVQKG